MKTVLSIFVAFLVAVMPIMAQQGATPVQQTAQMNNAATVAGTSVTSAATITIGAVGGQYFYLTGIDIQNCAGSSAVTAATVTTVTTTNLPGSVAYTVGSGVTAGLCTNQSFGYTYPIKSLAPGTATTFVLPTFATNQTVRVNVYGFYAQ